MKINDLLIEYQVCEQKIAEKFGLDALFYYFRDLTRMYWAQNNEDISYSEKPDDIDDNSYGAEVYGTSMWNSEGYTLFVVYNNGEKEMWLFDDTRKCFQGD